MKKKLKKLKEKTKNSLSKLKKKIKGKEKKEKLTRKQRIIKEIRDWGISIAAALLIYYVILPAILGTSTPMVIVSSCSQEPHLNIGDVLILQGTSMEEIEAPTVKIEEELNYTYNNETNRIVINGQEIETDTENDIVTYIPEPPGTQVIHRSLAKIEFSENASPEFLAGEKILLTQGDANPIPDQVTREEINAGKRAMCISLEQEGMIVNLPHDMDLEGQEDLKIIPHGIETCLSTPVTEERIVGRKTGPRIPLLGHVKLFFCDVMPFCDGHANPGTEYEYKLSC